MNRISHEHRFIDALRVQGRTPAQILDELVLLGWHPASARRAIEGGRPDDDHAGVPGPDLEQLPTTLDFGVHQVRVLAFTRLPQTCLFGDFLTGAECEGLIALSKPHMERSQVVVNNGQENAQGVMTYARTSDQASLKRGTSPLVDAIYARVAEATRWPQEQMESMQVVRYSPGAEFVPHHDYFCPTVNADIIARSGQRVATMLLYLNTPPFGGATSFPDIEIEIMPQQGHALLFNYPRPESETLTLHAGVPLGAGEKWIATFFLVDRALAPASHDSTDAEAH